MTTSVRLMAKIDLVMPALLARTERMWRHPAPRELYLEWLRALHGMLRATVPLILDATTACLARDDEIARASPSISPATCTRSTATTRTW